MAAEFVNCPSHSYRHFYNYRSITMRMGKNVTNIAGKVGIEGIWGKADFSAKPVPGTAKSAFVRQ